MRLNLWDAEARGKVATDQGNIEFRTYVHATEPIMVIDLEATGAEKQARFVWEPASGQTSPGIQSPVNAQSDSGKRKDPPNPPGTTSRDGEIEVFSQPRHAGGSFATAWQQVTTPKGVRIYLSIADSFPKQTAAREALEAVRRASETDPDTLTASHREWWHALYPKSFVSIPDPRLESFYWIQIYKLASASRPDAGPVDLAGPWFRERDKSFYARIWWNLNIETLYLPVYKSNHLELGESLVRTLDEHRENFFDQAKNIWKCEEGATVSHTSDRQGRRGNGHLSQDVYLNPGDFTWILHNYYQHYRYSMDHTLITDQKTHAFFPLLRGSVNVYLSLLEKGADGRLHLAKLHSPEYGNDTDTTYNLALLRWGLETLLSLNDRYKLNDPLAPKWQDTLVNLTDYPKDENGLKIGATMPFSKAHRHWSHMMMVHPLHTMDLEDPKNRELFIKTLRHWIALGTNTNDWDRILGWSHAAAASLYSAIGEGDNALDQIHKHVNYKSVASNTLFYDPWPCIEGSIVLNRSIQDLLIQSQNHLIQVFPAVPSTWKDAVFHDLRAEGAFLVSAERRDGRTRWVRIKSLAGEPCRIAPGLQGDVKATVEFTALGQGKYSLKLAKGEEALLYIGDRPENPIIQPLEIATSQRNLWGLKSQPTAPKTSKPDQN